MATQTQAYQCRALDLFKAIDEMHDWLVQQSIIHGNGSNISIQIYCSKQHMDLSSFRQHTPAFRQRLFETQYRDIKFNLVENGPHKVVLEKTMSQGWLGKLKEMFSEPQENVAAPAENTARANLAEQKVVHVKPEHNPYISIQRGVELSSRLLMSAVRKHQLIAPEDEFVLRHIKLRGIDEQNQALLLDFEREFGAAQRSGFIKRLLQSQPALSSIVLDDLTVEIATENAAATQDQFECVTQALNDNSAVEGVDVQIFGEWQACTRAPSVSVSEVSQPSIAQSTPIVPVQSDITIVLRVFDGQTPQGREIEIKQFPCQIGKSPSLNLVLDGTFVSSKHLKLDCVNQRITLTDIGSTNGTWLNGQNDKLLHHQDVALSAGDSIRLAAKLNDSKDVAIAPRIQVVSISGAPNSALATPVISMQSTPLLSTTLANLSIQDANGTREMSISCCPFYIGRGHDQHYVVPQDNLNVSSKHIEILAINQKGATVKNLAVSKNGIAKANAMKELLPAEFDWPFGEELVLAPKDLARAVRLTLLAP